jgi:hypothetical protein
MNSKTPFAATRNCKEFMHELMQSVVNQYGKKVTELIPRENIQSFYHGMNWSFQQENAAGYTTQTGELQKQGTTVRLAIDRIREHDISLLPEFLNATVEDMQQQMQERLFSMLDKVTQMTGQVTAVPKGGSIAQAALDALEKIQLSVDEDGNVSLPTLYLNPASYEKMANEITAIPSAQSGAAKKVIEKKKAEAVVREQERLSRYEE